MTEKQKSAIVKQFSFGFVRTIERDIFPMRVAVSVAEVQGALKNAAQLTVRVHSMGYKYGFLQMFAVGDTMLKGLAANMKLKSSRQMTVIMRDRARELRELLSNLEFKFNRCGPRLEDRGVLLSAEYDAMNLEELETLGYELEG